MSTRRKPTKSRSAQVREGLDHPVIDGDGHMIEVEAVLFDYLKQVGGASLVKDYEAFCEAFWSPWYDSTPQERKAQRVRRVIYWGFPARNTTDRATAMLPRLMRSRLDELGIDISIVYPTLGILLSLLEDADMRWACTRATNMMNAELYGPYSDRLIPAAVIPMHTPQSAIEEMDFVVTELGMKVVSGGSVRRSIASVEPSPGGATQYVDFLGMDSAYDYDPVWQKCIDLGVAFTSHTGSQGLPDRSSPSSFVFNHMGSFAAHHEGQCKAMLLGGVTRRFPDLRVAFLEGGVGWAVSLYNQLFEHWEKRNLAALKRHLDPALVDRTLLGKLIEEFGEDRHRARIGELRGGDGPYWQGRWREKPEELDEFAASGVQSKQDIHDLFVPSFYFGCEADDRSVAWAFDTRLNVLGARLNAMFSSDIGHWDVTDATQCVAESHELVEEGHLSGADYRDFVFDNAVRLHAGMNPDFFRGTAVEVEAAKVMNGGIGRTGG